VASDDTAVNCVVMGETAPVVLIVAVVTMVVTVMLSAIGGRLDPSKRAQQPLRIEVDQSTAKV
jgi:hypothetical protein